MQTIAAQETTGEQPLKPQTRALVLTGIADFTLIPESAYATRDTVLAQARAVRAVFDDASRDAAIAAVKELKDARVSLGKFKDFAKAPVTALAKKIEGDMATFAKDLGVGTGEANQGPEEKRLLQLLNRHEMELRRQREEAERKRLAEEEAARQAEIERIKEIARREEAARLAEEQARLAAEKAARARSDAGRANAAAAEAEAQEAARKAKEDAERLALEQEQASADRKQREEEERQRAATIAAPVPGMKAAEKWTYEIVNIAAFAAQYPDLVKIEIKHRETLESINAGFFDYALGEGEQNASPESLLKPGTIRVAPGLRIFRETKINIR